MSNSVSVSSLRIYSILLMSREMFYGEKMVTFSCFLSCFSKNSFVRFIIKTSVLFELGYIPRLNMRICA